MRGNKSKSADILKELEVRFIEGEKLTVEQIISEYLKSTSTINYLLGREQVKNWLSTLKKKIWRGYSLWFGCLNDLHQYGICSTEAEYRYSLIRYFSFIKGNIRRAIQLKGEANARGLLTDVKDATLALPAPIAEEKKK